MAALRELKNSLGVTSLLLPAANLTADTNSSSVDTRGFDSTMVVAHVGNSADVLSGSVFIELELEESDDDSVWNDCADIDVLDVSSETTTNTGTFALIDAPAEDSRPFKAAYIGNKRYVRLVVNVTGTHTSGTPISAVAVQGHAHQTPVV
jgi:hypothetical protein